MALKLCESIKKYRTERGVTQDKFAEYLGVTPQAVSRWENGAGYPDIELLPGIATFFGVSLDKLMGVDLSEAEQNRMLERFATMLKNGDLDTLIKEGEDAVKRFPANYPLISVFATAFIVKYPRDNESTDAERNACFERCVPMLRRVVDDCKEMIIVISAKNLLVVMLNKLNREQEALQIAATMPSISFSAEGNIAMCLYGNDRIEYMKSRLPLVIAIFTAFIARADYTQKGDMPQKRSRHSLEKLLAIWDIAYDTPDPSLAAEKTLNAAYMMILLRCARACCNECDDEAAVCYLKRAADCLTKIDNYKEGLLETHCNDALKAALVLEPECTLTREELNSHNASYALYHTCIEKGWFERLNGRAEYTEICNVMQSNAR